MTPLVDRPFWQSFTFERPVAAPYHDRFGAVQVALADEPRFDHTLAGVRRGLLVEPGAGYGQHDAPLAAAGDWSDVRQATVMFEWEYPPGGEGAGTIGRRALYSVDVRASVNAMLRIAGWHRKLLAVPGFLPNLGAEDAPGYVKYRAAQWWLGNALSAGDGFALGDEDGRVVIESA